MTDERIKVSFTERSAFAEDQPELYVRHGKNVLERGIIVSKSINNVTCPKCQELWFMGVYS